MSRNYLLVQTHAQISLFPQVDMQMYKDILYELLYSQLCIEWSIFHLVMSCL